MEFDESIDEQLRGIIERTVYVKTLKSVLLGKSSESDQGIQLIIFRLHHWVEDIFDSILNTYIGSRILDSKTIDSIPACLSPENVCDRLIFNGNFDYKTGLICEVFMLSEPTKQRIKSLNKVRNGIAHRYKSNHHYFKYKKKNIIEDWKGLEVFVNDVAEAIKEIVNISQLIDSILIYKEKVL